MKFSRLGAPGSEIPVVHLDGSTYDLRPLTSDIDGAFLASGPVARVAETVDAGDLEPLPDASSLRIGAPIARPGKLICVGLNYAGHAAETGAKIPAEPIIFLKGSDTVVGPYDDVLIPRGSTKTDWEVELGVVIGRTARYLGPDDDALDYIAGYVVSHDVSEREFQLERGGQWTKGKSCETFNPLGPWLVTADEVPDPQALALSLQVNGVPRQASTTDDMIFPVAELIRYLSGFMVLEPGDLINTGTPAGVGLGIEGNPYLRDGDVVELTIEGLGAARQKLVQA
ncbi:fumarylacetoacetate hydrolase family protein [Microbacterium rhizosphaerae]|uniref:Fumarylacetoacetate hydrolase family protein n=1 Tax=Microbacterium rhizosphaerae TaxID=1678237 RepID=A0ABZ0SPE3_9MICO|nr:fumarylacetoacetate hydrolase family protein [Microbacterium rhizosphaerae]WPR89122.1 fumarylacetoacetate hydrolase family protein [Microbacterium rhizosphaerae]